MSCTVMWTTVFDNGYWHVVPLDEEGEVLKPHVPSSDCSCCPEIEYEEPDEEDEETSVKVLLIHNQIN